MQLCVSTVSWTMLNLSGRNFIHFYKAMRQSVMHKNYDSALDIFGVIFLWSFAMLFHSLHKNHNSALDIFGVISLWSFAMLFRVRFYLDNHLRYFNETSYTCKPHSDGKICWSMKIPKRSALSPQVNTRLQEQTRKFDKHETKITKMIHKRSTTLRIDKSLTRAVDFDVASDCAITHKLWSTHSEQSVYVCQHWNIFKLPVKLKIVISYHRTFQQEVHMLLAGKKNPYNLIMH